MRRNFLVVSMMFLLSVPFTKASIRELKNHETRNIAQQMTNLTLLDNFKLGTQLHVNYNRSRIVDVFITGDDYKQNDEIKKIVSNIHASCTRLENYMNYPRSGGWSMKLVVDHSQANIESMLRTLYWCNSDVDRDRS